MLEIEKLGLVEMDSQQVNEVDGGVFFLGSASSIFKKIGWGYIGTQIVDNWDDIKAGFREGYAAGSR